MYQTQCEHLFAVQSATPRDCNPVAQPAFPFGVAVAAIENKYGVATVA